MGSSEDALVNHLNGVAISVIYLSLYILLLFLIIVKSYQKDQSFTKNVSRIWKLRSIYSTVLVQIFDQASDIGVLILWWQYAIDENEGTIDVPHIDMTLMVYFSLFSLILSRCINATVVAFTGDYSKNDFERYIDIILCLFELYVIKQVWKVHKYQTSLNNNSKMEMAISEQSNQAQTKMMNIGSKEQSIEDKNDATNENIVNIDNNNEMKEEKKVNSFDADNNKMIENQMKKVDSKRQVDAFVNTMNKEHDTWIKNNGNNNSNNGGNDASIEPTPEMRTSKWIEAIFESFPQVLFQSVFIIRTFDTPFDINSNQRVFFAFSLMWSVISTSNKFVVIDRRDTVFHPQSHKMKDKKYGKISMNMDYIYRILWRYFHITSRLCIVVLLWTVCGGPILAIFTFVTYIMFLFQIYQPCKEDTFVAKIRRASKIVDNYCLLSSLFCQLLKIRIFMENTLKSAQEATNPNKSKKDAIIINNDNNDDNNNNKDDNAKHLKFKKFLKQEKAKININDEESVAAFNKVLVSIIEFENEQYPIHILHTKDGLKILKEITQIMIDIIIDNKLKIIRDLLFRLERLSQDLNAYNILCDARKEFITWVPLLSVAFSDTNGDIPNQLNEAINKFYSDSEREYLYEDTVLMPEMFGEFRNRVGKDLLLPKNQTMYRKWVKFFQSVVSFLFFHYIGVMWTREEMIFNGVKRKPFYLIFHRYIENIFGLILVLIFALVKFDCGNDFCANYEIRNIYSNLYVLIYTIVASFAIVFGEAILILALYKKEMLITFAQEIGKIMMLPYAISWEPLFKATGSKIALKLKKHLDGRVSMTGSDIDDIERAREDSHDISREASVDGFNTVMQFTTVT